MEYAKDTMTYDFSRFDMNAAPEIPVKVEIEEVPQRPKTQRELHNERARDARLVVRVMGASLLLMLLLSIQILTNLKLNEYTDMYYNEKLMLSVAKSENVRLQVKYDEMISPERIAEIAEQKFGMVKREQSQVTYFDLAKEDKVVISK